MLRVKQTDAASEVVLSSSVQLRTTHLVVKILLMGLQMREPRCNMLQQSVRRLRYAVVVLAVDRHDVPIQTCPEKGFVCAVEFCITFSVQNRRPIGC